jgi:hypothetical protein
LLGIRLACAEVEAHYFRTFFEIYQNFLVSDHSQSVLNQQFTSQGVRNILLLLELNGPKDDLPESKNILRVPQEIRQVTPVIGYRLNQLVYIFVIMDDTVIVILVSDNHPEIRKMPDSQGCPDQGNQLAGFHIGPDAVHFALAVWVLDMDLF